MTTYNIVSPGALVSGQPEDISVILANLQAIAAVINGGLDNGNLNASAAIAASKLAGYPADVTKALLGDGTWGAPGAGVAGVPTGVILPYGAVTPPTGWLACDGAAVSRTTYATLFGVLSTSFGTGDGTTTFNVPDLQGRAPVGKGTHVDVDTLGKNDGVAVASRTTKHRHTVTDPGHTHTLWAGSIGGASGDVNGRNAESGYGGMSPATTGITVGPAGAALDTGPYIVVAYIIKT
jgi:microcystin-dependent protein